MAETMTEAPIFTSPVPAMADSDGDRNINGNINTINERLIKCVTNLSLEGC